MKKLISLLSALTISGIAIPTTIAASPYQKEEHKLQNIANIEKLNRSKREPCMENIGKSISVQVITQATGGAATGAMTGAVAGGVGAAPGAALGAITGATTGIITGIIDEISRC